ncbi:MAG: Holliday junction branch migration protein RuvA, partial [Chloroflexota bacterium]
HLVREDAQSLYGFSLTQELVFFELITTVSGVGPKVGLAIVSSRPVPDLELAILQGDDAVLTAVSGVGKRLAGRIVLELKEKVAAAGDAAVGTGGGEAEVIAALEALGYSSREGREAARLAVSKLGPEATLEDRVKDALGALRRA